MSNLKQCTFLDTDRAKIISKWIILKMKSGVSSPVDMYTEFYAHITKAGIKEAEKLIYLNSFGRIYSRRILVYQMGNPEQMERVAGTNINDATAIYNYLDSADKIEAFIQYNFIEKNLPDLLKKKPEGLVDVPVFSLFHTPADEYLESLKEFKTFQEKLEHLKKIGFISPITIDGKTVNAIDFSDRVMVLAKIGNMNVPFYISTGLAGKKDVAAGKWYSVFGIGQMSPTDNRSWINKGRSADMPTQYNQPVFQKIARILDQGIGSIKLDENGKMLPDFIFLLDEQSTIDQFNAQMNFNSKPGNREDGSAKAHIVSVIEQVNGELSKMVADGMGTKQPPLPENPDQESKEEAENAQKIEDKILQNQAEFEMQKEIEALKAEAEALKENVRENIQQLLPDGTNFAEVKRLAIRNGLVQLIGLKKSDTGVRVFSYDEDSKTFSEHYNGQVLNDFLEDDFLKTFQGHYFLPRLSLEQFARKKSVKTLADKTAMLEHAAAEFKLDNVMNVFANSFSKDQRTEDLFTIDKKGKLQAGPLAIAIQKKNQALKSIRKELGGTNDYRKIGNVVKQVFPDGKVTLELSDDQSITDEIINVVLTKKNKEKIILGNMMYILDVNLMKGVNGGSEYQSHLKTLADQIKNSKGSLDITASEYRISDPYLPGQRFNDENKIYPQDQFRYGKNKDISKAEKLSFAQGLELMTAMGYGVSQAYIDKYANSEGTKEKRPVFSGTAVIAYSPFLEGHEIDAILQKEAIDGSSNFDFEKFSKTYNISFMSLRGKPLTFEDYVKLIKDNDTVFKRQKKTSDNELEIEDTGKKDALFNIGQSFYLHYRLANGIQYLEETVKGLTGEVKRRMEMNILHYKAMLFAPKDYFSTMEADKDFISFYKDNFKEVMSENGTISLSIAPSVQEMIDKNYNQYIGSDITERVKKSEYFAAHLFGYFPDDHASPYYKKKALYAQKEGNGDDARERYAMRFGGIFGDKVIDMIKDLGTVKSKVNGQSFSEFWQDTTGGKGTNDRQMPMPTYNPVHTVKNAGFSNAKIGQLSPLNQWSKHNEAITSKDVSDQYLQVDLMPMMPHFKFDFSGKGANRNDSNTARSKRSGKTGKVNSAISKGMDDAFNKVVNTEQFEGLSYEISEDGAKEIYESLLGEIKGELELLQSPIEIAEGMIVGRVGKNLMQLHAPANKISEKVLRHEIMHRVINEAISPESRKKLYQEAKTKMVTDSNGRYLDASEISDREADEFLAESYEETYGQYENKILKKLPKIIADFFLFIQRFYDKIRGKQSLFREVVVKLESGYFINNGLQYDGYNGQMLNKVVESETIARLFESDLEAGMNRVEKIKGSIVASVQDIMYGKQVNEDILNNQNPKGYQQALQEAKDTLLFKIEGSIDADGNEQDGYFDRLTESEQMLFEINGEFNADNITNSFLEGIKETIRTSSKQTTVMFNMLVTYANYSDLAKKAMPFLKDSQYHFDADVLVDDEVESHNKIRQMFERSEIPAYSTFSERVRFFMYNTKMDATDTAFGAENVFRQYVDTFFKKSQERALKSLSNMNGLTTGLMINSMKQELKSLEEFPSSAQYRSAKAVFDRFYNLENQNSFISIASNTDPAYKFQAQAHQSVINAIESAQKSVVTQEFLKVESTRFGMSFTETTESDAKNFKNRINDKIAKKLFVKSMQGVKSSYRLSPDAKSAFFDRSSDYNLAFNESGEMVVTLFNKSYIYPKGQIKRGQKNNLSDVFINQLVGDKAVNQLSTIEIQKLLDDLGMTISFDALNKFMSTPSLKKRVVETAVHSYLILARQYSDEKENYFKPDLKLEIEFLTNGRQDNISKILKEDTRGVSASNENLDTVEIEEEGTAGMVFSPTTFHNFFEELGAAQQLNSYDNRDNIVYIMEGSKENKDKFPSYIHRAMANLSKIRAYSKEQALRETVTEEQYRDEKFSAIHSNTYKNVVFKEDNFIGEVFYLKGIQNKQTNKSKSFTDMNDREFSRTVLGLILGKTYEADFYSPMEIQANRGFLPVQKMSKNRRFGVSVNKEGYNFDDRASQELELLRRIPFHHAGRVMQQIYEVMEAKGKPWAVGKSQAVAGYLSKIELGKIQKEWTFLQKKLNEELSGNEKLGIPADLEFIKDLSEKKHYLVDSGKIVLPPLLTQRMEFSKDSHQEYVRELYLEFAEDMYAKLATEGKYDMEFKFSKDWFNGKASSLNLPEFHNPNIDSLVSLFQQEKIKDTSYAGLSNNEKIKLYHPALMSVFLTYYINENELTQALSGDPYLYKADKDTGSKNLHSYMTDYSKRQAGVTTPKIEMTFRETILDQQLNEIRVNKNALNPKLRISHVTDTMYNSIENPETHALLAKANNTKENQKKIKEGFTQKANDGSIYGNMLSMQMMMNSMGNENGFRIGTVFKGHGYSFDLKNGHVNYAKGATQVITPEALEMDEGYLHLILQNQYKHALISGPGLAPNTDLWTIFMQYKKETGSYEKAENKLADLYFSARNNENGFSMEGDIVNFTIPLASEKGNALSINPIEWLSGSKPFLNKDDSTYSEMGTEGFGAILDLQKDIQNKDNDVSLSTQLVFLLGINGDNHKDAVKMYNEIKKLSNAEKESIADEIYNTLNNADVPRPGILQNKTALRKWFLKKVNSSYSAKGDYGLIYDLTSEIGVSSISHPVLFEEIYSNVASAISKGILMRMNGFKAIQLPAHNTFMIYVDAKGNYYTKPEIDKLSEEQILEAGISRRNLAYSKLKDGRLTDTEIFAPNVLARDFLVTADKDLPLNDIFVVPTGEGVIDFQAENSEILETNNHKKKLIAYVMETDADWSMSPVVKSMKKIMGPKLYAKIMAKEALEDVEKAGFAELFAGRAIEMNRALYGVISRIPGTGKNSSTPVRIVGFINSYQNTVFAPVEWMLISGSDYDGDTVQFWNYSNKNVIGSKALRTARKILRRETNVNEIFSEINFELMEARAKSGKEKLLDGGKKKGYVMGSLKTLIDLRSNNSTGTQMTGINATESKVHAYGSMAKTRALHYLQDSTLDPSIQAIVAKKISVRFTDKKTGEVLSLTPFENNLGDYKDTNGNLIYKWKETLTNAAIDNAKHLFMNFLGLNKVNSGLQQALSVMGVSPDVIIDKIIQNPSVVAAVNSVIEDSDINNTFGSSLESFIKKKLSKSKEVTEDGEEVDEDLNSIVKEMQPTIKQLLSENKEGGVQEIAVDFTDENSVYQFLHFLNEVNKEMNNIRKTVKVTDKIPGMTADQDYSIKEIFRSINKRSGSAQINQIKTLKALLRRMDKATNPFSITEVAKAYANTITVHPYVLLATMPHLRAYMMRWLEFTEMKSAHLLYGEKTQAVLGHVQSQLDYTSMANPRNVAKIQKDMFKFINGVFLEENFSNHEFEGKSYNLGNIAEAQEFKESFARTVRGYQIGKYSKNNFINKLEIIGSDIIFPGSESMDKDLTLPPREGFKGLDEKTKIAFMLYEAISGNFLYKKGGLMAFMDKKSAMPFLEFANKAEKGLISGNDLIIRDSADGKMFADSFIKNNVDLAKKITGNESPDAKKNSFTWFPKSVSEIQDSWIADTKSVMAQFEIRTESKKFKKQVEDIETKIAALKEDLVEVLDTDPEKDLKLTQNSSPEEKINELESQLADMFKRSIILPQSPGLPPYKIIRFYNKEALKIEYFIYELTFLEGKEGEGSQVRFDRVFIPVEKFGGLHYYRRKKVIPTVSKREHLVYTDQEASEYFDKKGSDKNATLHNFKGEKYTFDENSGMKKFSLSTKKGSPAAISKAKLIASVINQVFPNIKIHLRKNMGKTFADKAAVVHNGEIFFNMDRIAIDTPMHEFGHIFIDLLEKTDPVMFSKISDLVIKTEEFGDVSEKYKKFGNSEVDNIKEAFVTMLGYHFENTFAEKLTDLSDQDRTDLIDSIDAFIEKVKDIIRYVFKQANIRKQYINERIIENFNTSTTLEDMFTLLGGAVMDGKVITDISSKQMEELERSFENKPAKVSESEVTRIIEQMMMKGTIKNYC